MDSNSPHTQSGGSAPLVPGGPVPVPPKPATPSQPGPAPVPPISSTGTPTPPVPPVAPVQSTAPAQPAAAPVPPAGAVLSANAAGGPTPPAAEPTLSANTPPDTRPTSTKPKQPKISKSTLIALAVLGVVAVIIIIVAVCMVVIPQANQSPKTDTTANVDNTPQQSSTNRPTPVADLTKEEAIEAVTEMMTYDYAPYGLFDEQLTATNNYSYYVLGASYDEVDKVDATTFGFDSELDSDLEIAPVDDLYVIGAVMDEGEVVFGSDVGISFNQEYLDYQFADEASDDSASTDGSVVFFDTSDEFIQQALPIVALTMDPLSNQINTIYDYEFTDYDDGTALTLYNMVFESVADSEEAVTADDDEADVEASEETAYCISFYATEYMVDKDTGKLTLPSSSSAFSAIKSFDLTAEEAADLVEIIEQIYGE